MKRTANQVAQALANEALSYSDVLIDLESVLACISFAVNSKIVSS